MDNTWEKTGEGWHLGCCFTLHGRNFVFAKSPQQTAKTGESIWRFNDYG